MAVGGGGGAAQLGGRVGGGVPDVLVHPCNNACTYADKLNSIDGATRQSLSQPTERWRPLVATESTWYVLLGVPQFGTNLHISDLMQDVTLYLVFEVICRPQSSLRTTANGKTLTI